MDLLVTVPDERASFVKKLLRELNLSVKAAPAAKPVRRKMTADEQKWVDNFRESLREVELHEQGKIELPSAYDLLNEI